MEYLGLLLTLSTSSFQCEVWSSRCQSKPPVLLRLQVLLQELLSFIIKNKDQVSSTSLTPPLCTEEGSAQTHKLVTGAVKSFLKFWAGQCVLLSVTSPTKEKGRENQCRESRSVHLCLSLRTWFRFSGNMTLKGDDVKGPDSDQYLGIISDTGTASFQLPTFVFPP